MASTKLSIHIPHDASAMPETILILVDELSNDPERSFETSKELQEYLMVVRGTPNRSELIAIARNLGILVETDQGIKISDIGCTLKKVRDDARRDLLHFLLYVGWTKTVPKTFLPSWAYRQVCDEYWEKGEVDLNNNTYLDQQVGETINIAHTTFSQMNVGEFDEISFSRQSIRGAHNWLEAVHPPVIDGKTFKRRSFCPPELVMMAIGYALQEEDNVLGIDILLTPEKREVISKICLLEPDALDRALDWTLPIFSHLVKPGTTAGFYGRFIRLNRVPTLQDMVR